MNKEFEKGREYESARESMWFHLWFGYGSIIFLGFFVIKDILSHRIDNISVTFALLLFGLSSLFLGYSEKKKLEKKLKEKEK